MFASIVGKKNIEISKENILIIYPQNSKQIKECFILANKLLLQIKVISQGKNWGYQTSTPPTIIVMNLSKMDKILNFNEEQQYITIQPGVSFLQVYKFLLKKKSSLMLTMTGGPSMGSVIATSMERGIGKGIYGDLYNHCHNLEVVLPNGNIIHTSVGVKNRSQISSLSTAVSGPILDGLFSQSSFGVVTEMSVELIRKPEYYFFCTHVAKNDIELPQLIDAIRDLRRMKIVQGNFLLANPYRMLSHEYQYPWEETSETPLPEYLLNKMMKEQKIIGKWTGHFMVSAPDIQILRRYKEILCEKLQSISVNIEIVDKKHIDNLRHIYKHFKKDLSTIINNKMKSTLYFYTHSTFLGVPADSNLRGMYWRKKTTPTNFDPTKDQCGVLWFNAILPMEGKSIQKIIPIIENKMKSYTFEPNIGINFIKERHVYLIGEILYDAALSEEVRKAHACLNDVTHTLFANGYYPYRNASLYMQKQYKEEEYVDLLLKIKKIVDPGGVLV